MNTQVYFESLIAACLGMLVNILIKIVKTNKRLIAANSYFSLKRFIKEEWANFLLIFACNALLIYMLPALLNWKPWVISFIRPFYAVVGYSGSSIALAFLSKSEKSVLKTIDKQTGTKED